MTTLDLDSIRFQDCPDVEYTAGLDKAMLRVDLWSHTAMYAPLFPDAHEQALAIEDEERFLQWRAGLRLERKGKFAGEDFMERFGAILMPANLIRVGQVALQFHVPFGLAFCRLKECGAIKIKDGAVEWATEHAKAG
jgi:hypothetical protein